MSEWIEDIKKAGPYLLTACQTAFEAASTAASKDLTPQERGLLDALASGESGGQYNIIAGGAHFSSFADHPGGGAAGRYLLLSTWRAAKAGSGVKDFSQESQDKAALWLARRDYRRNTGRDLDTDLKSGSFNSAGLSTWVSINPGWKARAFIQA